MQLGAAIAAYFVQHIITEAHMQSQVVEHFAGNALETANVLFNSTFAWNAAALA